MIAELTGFRRYNAPEVVAVLKVVRAPVAPSWLRSVVARTAEVPEVAARLPTEDWDIAVKLSGDRELRRLNRRFLGDDHATDVLSFPTGEKTAGAHLGDIVVSWPAAVRQGHDHGHGSRFELGLLVVHGFLHLLGWDHQSEVEEREMSRLTIESLRRSAIEIASRRLMNPDPPG